MTKTVFGQVPGDISHVGVVYSRLQSDLARFLERSDRRQRKLRELEEGYEEARADTEDEHLRELELESLRRLINQLKEEIARYEAHRPAPRKAAR